MGWKMTKKASGITLFLLIFTAAFLLSKPAIALSGGGPDTGGKIRIEREWKGSQSGYTFPSKYIIETDVQWGEVWDKVHRFRHPKPALPEIDFKNETVIAVFMGVKKSGGYDIFITEIIETEKEINVMVKERKPSPDTVQIMVLTQPYHIVVIKKRPLPIRFNLP
jgi:hypothetical protein